MTGPEGMAMPVPSTRHPAANKERPVPLWDGPLLPPGVSREADRHDRGGAGPPARSLVPLREGAADGRDALDGHHEHHGRH
ncbi:MAG: hypothetical protein QM605_05340, partial [Sphingobium sp.]